ncbi:MAG: hypothetical protein K2Y39_17090 [Candidatus Obscuribacterales bacterium]|nr:hypothetical protein [Candidatus Obscuribacterales bacterium]
MMFNSMSYVFKDAFYNLEKVFTRLKNPPQLQSQNDRLHSIHQKKEEASMSSGEFLSRARRGEALHQDKQSEEICKEFVRTKSVFPIDENNKAVESEIPLPQVVSKSITDEMPVFGLKASLHASTDHASFDNWKSVHHLLLTQPEESETPSSIDEDTANKLKAVGKAWRELSVHTALRLIDHPYTPAFVLMELSQHPSPEVRAQVVDHPNTPRQAVLNLIRDQCIDVRLSLAECYHLGVSILEILVDDDNPYVANRAEITLQRLQANSCPSVIRGLFGKSDLPSSEEENVTKIRALA